MSDLPVKLNKLKVVLRLEDRTLCVKTIGYIKHRLTRTVWGCPLEFRISTHCTHVFVDEFLLYTKNNDLALALFQFVFLAR